MAKISFKRGNRKKFPNIYREGTFYIAEDEHALYLDVSGSKRIRIGGFQEFDTLEELKANSNPNNTALYYIKSLNCLAKYDGSDYIQINLDTGATSAEVTGFGNAVTSVTYDATNRKLILEMGETFATKTELGELAEKDEVGKENLSEELSRELNGKVNSISAADQSVSISGETTAPKVGVKISTKAGNLLKLNTTEGEEGLEVTIPELSSISITTAPTKTIYSVGEKFDSAGMVVKATYTNSATVEVSGFRVFPDGPLRTADTSVTVQYSDGDVTVSATQAVTVTTAKIYGAFWDGTSTTKWARTDASRYFVDPIPYVAGAENYGSPFDSLQPWAGMVRVTDDEAGELVAIPKFWYELKQNGRSIQIRIADAAVNGFSVSPAHMDRGDGRGERDVVYIGRYHCSTSDYKSTTDVKPKANITRSAARASIHNLGDTVWQSDFAMRFTLWLLYLVEFADWNTQKTIGMGCGNNSATGNMGYTDDMPYHTGTALNSRDTYGLGTQYRNIEGLWDNAYDWCDGCYYNGNGLNLILNPGNFDDTTGGSFVGKPSSGFPSAFTVSTAGGFPVFYPTAANGSGDTYSCDGWYFNSSNPCLYVGGSYTHSVYRGLFYVYSYSTSYSYAHFGCRLQKLP